MNPSNIINQILLAVADILPDALSQSKNYNIWRYDCVVGLIGEPFWFYYGFKTEQWAFCLLEAIFFFVCLSDFYHKWILKNPEFDEDDNYNNRMESNILSEKDIEKEFKNK